jgi:hemerythrin-like domain-containing protein
MADAIQILIHEHESIEKALASLETFVESLGTQPDREREAVRDYVYFFHELVDTCHHGKEEGFLFPKMTAYGFSKEAGPVSAMLSEQGEGREHLTALALIGQGVGPLTSHEREVVRGHALGYIMRIRPHMAREEDILFPIVVHSLPEFVIEELGREFEGFDKKDLPPDFHEKLGRISRDLIAAYPPKPAK